MNKFGILFLVAFVIVALHNGVFLNLVFVAALVLIFFRFISGNNNGKTGKQSIKKEVK